MRVAVVRRIAVAPVLMLALAVSACSGAADATPLPSPSVTVAPLVAYGDGTLTIGTLLSRADPVRADALIAGVEAAVRDARASVDAGAVGVPAVRTLHRALPAPEAVGPAVVDLAGRGVDVILLDVDAVGLPEAVAAAAEARVGVLLVGGSESVTDTESARVRLEDPGLADGAPGVPALRVATLAILAAVAAGDDGGLSVVAALPWVTGGASTCSDVTPCVDAITRGYDIDYLPLAGITVLPAA